MKTIHAKHLKLAIVFLLAFATDFAKAQTCTASCSYVVGANGNVVLTATTPIFSPAYYTWNFAAGSGGGYSITYTSNPTASFTYSSNGCYVIGLQIGTGTGTMGCYNNLQNTICVNTVPCNTTPLTFTTYVGSNGMVSFFNTNGSVLVPISGFSQVWNFGDSGTSTVTAGTSANHTYSANGTYTVDLTITNTNYTPACISTGSTVVTITNVPATCNASFNYSVGANGQVTFSSTSTGSISAAPIYTWSFGLQASPSYTFGNIPTISTTYSANGIYTVYLSINDYLNNPGGAFCSTSQTIAINTAPCNLNANFISTVVSYCGWVNFSNTTSGAASGTSYLWSFGDGSTLTSSSLYPSHNYTTNGTYIVTLTATNNNYIPACVSTQTAVVTVTAAVTPAFTYSLGANGQVTFSNTSTVVSSNPSSSYTWNFGAQAIPSYTQGFNGIPPTVSATYTANGTYVVMFAIDPCYVWTQQTITINSVGTGTCNLNSAFTYTQSSNGVVNFNNTSTGTTSNTSYHWAFGDGSNSNVASPSHTYASNGTYTVHLIDSTNICSSVYVAIVTVSSVTNTPCNLNTNFTYTTGANGICYFNNTTTGAIAQTTYTWNFGDGSSSSANSPSRTYASNGNYFVTLYANLNPASAAPLACIDSTSHSVIISNVTNTCIANTTFSIVPAGSPHSWYAVVTNTGNVATAQWTWGDSSASSFGIITSHTYAAAGNYNICLTVTTTCGTIGMHCSSQYLSKTEGESADIIYINCITSDMLPTGIKNNSAPLVSCVIAPNPNSGEFNVNVNGVNSAAKIQVYNLIGELIFETVSEVDNGSINKKISLNSTLNGIYFIKVSAGDNVHTQKLIINK